MINWQGIEISIHNNNVPHNLNECENNGKVFKDTSYQPHNGESMENHENAKHLNESEKKQFE